MKRERRLERKYEGPEVLQDLLTRSGCELTVDDVREEFHAAVEEGTQANEVLPLLWELEPRFDSPEMARRTFVNLFGLWDEVEAGFSDELVVLPVEQDPDAPLTQRYVDHAWAKLDALSEKDARRARDRYENVHGDAPAWLFEQLAHLSQTAVETALELCFELYWIAEDARGDRVPRANRAALEAAHAETDDLEEEPEPALAALVTATLWEHAADEESPLPEEDIPPVERALRAVRRVLVP